jgi:hypothetical protein
MLAWFITRSGWSVRCQETGRVILESREGREVVVELIWDDGGAPISELEISAPKLKAKISREAGNSHLCQSIRAEGHSVNFSGPADYDDSAGLVASQLSRGGKNSLFLNVLPQFMELLEGGD